MTLEQQVRQWKLVTVLAVALLFGYVAGQLAPLALAQASAQRTTPVQIDTSNCEPRYVKVRNIGWSPTTLPGGQGMVPMGGFDLGDGNHVLLLARCQ